MNALSVDLIVFKFWEELYRYSLAWTQVFFGLRPSSNRSLEHETPQYLHPRLGLWPHNSFMINILHIIIIVSSQQHHIKNLLTYTMTSFEHEKKFRTDLFDSNLVCILVFAMLIYDNNISVHDKEFYDSIQTLSLTLALHTLGWL